MGIFGDKPKQLPKTSENKKQPEMVSPQMVESLKIRHCEIRCDEGPEKKYGFLSRMLKPPVDQQSHPDYGWILSVTATVTLQGNLTANGVEVGLFLNYSLLCTASCDEWGKVSLCKRFHNKERQLTRGDKLTVRIKGIAIEDEVVLTSASWKARE